LVGAVARHAIKKVMKNAAVVVGLFVVALSYLSYKGWLDVKWIPIESTAKSTLADITNQAIHALNNTASNFQTHPSAVGSVAAAFGFMPGSFWVKKRMRSIGGESKYMKSKSKQARQQKRWKVPTPIKVAIGLFGTMCLVIAIVGSIHG
jgi:uncharacterized membrane protein (Fun14 family)